MADPDEKPKKLRRLRFTPASRRAYECLPDEVQNQIGFAVYRAELGKRHPDAKVLRGFGGASVVEVIVRHDGATYRAVYTLTFPGFVYLVHAFQKKSKTGIKTPKPELDAVQRGLTAAEKDYEERLPNERPAAEEPG
jgi:phage-related protein